MKNYFHVHSENFTFEIFSNFFFKAETKILCFCRNSAPMGYVLLICKKMLFLGAHIFVENTKTDYFLNQLQKTITNEILTKCNLELLDNTEYSKYMSVWRHKRVLWTPRLQTLYWKSFNHSLFKHVTFLKVFKSSQWWLSDSQKLYGGLKCIASFTKIMGTSFKSRVCMELGKC